MMELISIFLNRDWKVTFGCQAAESEYMADLHSLGVLTENIRLNDSGFDDLLKRSGPDVVMFDRFMTEEQFGWRVAENCPEAIRILDTEDLHSLRSGREEAFKQGVKFSPEQLLSNKVAVREMASILRCDLSLIISEAEMELLTGLFRVDREILFYLPFLMNPVSSTDVNLWPGFHQRRNFITIGNFLHAPNWDAINYLKKSIWPLIRKKIPDSELHVYGAYASDKVYQLHNSEEGFLIKGRAEDAKEVVKKARICLAPLRFGAGLKGKLAEAMVCGTPCVTTSVGEEGMAGKLPWPGFVADAPGEFSERAVELYEDEKLWKQSRQRGIEIINKRFSKSTFEPALFEYLDQIMKNRDRHRKQNFYGTLLMHHTMASTKYMSRWIEEKTKNQANE